jgi:glycosyltransferase involved in cell wall biosynthesis
VKIAVDISQIAYPGTGVGRFTDGLTRAILDHGKEHSWTFFFSSLRQELSPEIKKLIGESGQRLSEYKLPPSALSFLWNSLHRMKIEKLVGPQDWIITSDWTEAPSRIPKTTIIHDLAYLRHPDTVHPVIRKNQHERMRWVKKESRIIFADSVSTKNEIAELLGIPENKIIVNYPGVTVKRPDPSVIEKTLKKLKIRKPFMLTVGKIEPRKNLARLLNVFRRLNRNDMNLVVVGPKGWDMEFSKSIQGKDNIIVPGYICEEELFSLYRSCLLFIYPSLYEGFGYPVVEAMMCGTAVVTSNTSSLAEIGADTAALFDPEDENNMFDVILSLLENDKVREEYSKKGIMRGREFTWDRYYKKMVSALINNR